MVPADIERSLGSLCNEVLRCEMLDRAAEYVVSGGSSCSMDTATREGVHAVLGALVGDMARDATNEIHVSARTVENLRWSELMDRPTRAQWIKLRVLCEQRGWADGIDDPAFAGFVRRIAKVDNPLFLNKNGVRAVILGLERWIEHDRRSGKA